MRAVCSCLGATAQCTQISVNGDSNTKKGDQPTSTLMLDLTMGMTWLGGAYLLHLRELQVLCRVRVVERDRGLWENWLIAKTAFPSPRCDMSCARLVGAARSRYTRERREG